MKSAQPRRWEVVNYRVTGQARYGLVIESEDGERGCVDTSDITDAVAQARPPLDAADGPLAAVDEQSLLTDQGRRHE
jgi:hypothetical protein